MVVETRTTWFTYVVDRTQIVAADATSGCSTRCRASRSATPTQRLLTLTTCNPRWASTQRLIVFGHLDRQQPPQPTGRPPRWLAHRERTLMYAWIWRHLPGPLAAAAGDRALALVAAVVALLFTVVFPWAEHTLPVPARYGRPVTATPTAPAVAPRRVLVVDNYDSFVFNLVQYLAQLGAECTVRAQRRGRPGRPSTQYDGVLLSPGPGIPEKAGVCVELVRETAGSVPVLGVCLGHQAIAAAYGAIVERAPELLHGKTSEVEHEGAGVLAGLPSPFTATRYHSLSVRDGSAARRARGHRAHRGRRDHGAAPPRPAARGRAVPPRVGAHRGRPPAARQLAGDLRRRRCGAPQRRAGAGRRPPPEPRSGPLPAAAGRGGDGEVPVGVGVGVGGGRLRDEDGHRRAEPRGALARRRLVDDRAGLRVGRLPRHRPSG